MFTLRRDDYKVTIGINSYKRNEDSVLKLKFCIISLQLTIMLTIWCSILYYNYEKGNKSFCILAKWKTVVKKG
jgi:hypothetical protein